MDKCFSKGIRNGHELLRDKEDEDVICSGGWSDSESASSLKVHISQHTHLFLGEC